MTVTEAEQLLEAACTKLIKACKLKGDEYEVLYNTGSAHLRYAILKLDKKEENNPEAINLLDNAIIILKSAVNARYFFIF